MRSRRRPPDKAPAPAPIEASAHGGPRHGVARALSRMGFCSRSEAARLVRAGRVALNGAVVLDPEMPVVEGVDRMTVDGRKVCASERVYVAINKPRGLVVSASDERGRDTVYSLIADAGLPWLAPVGRLDQASEGLLLLSNDPAWAARITDPQSHVEKTYRVQVRGLPSDETLQQLREGIHDRGELLRLQSVRQVGGGDKNAWLGIVLAEGRNRQIRRMLGVCGHDVLRLLRVAIGTLALGELPKGAWRRLSLAEVSTLASDCTPKTARATALRQPATRPRSRSRSPARNRRPR
ncbi:MAG TPA: pseudouridine synthase [Rhodanobacteraceae bacterium]|nr:pseudouridine synthase [Rhodanobacteraceae bacterium]